MQKVRIKFAYKAGFRRLWLVASVIWLAVAAVILTRYSEVTAMDAVGTLLLPPLTLYVIGAAFVWIIEGFAKAD